MLANLAKVLDHGVELGHYLRLRLFKHDAIDESPALAVIFQFADLFENESTKLRGKS